MVNIIVNHSVEDYKKWRPVYDEHTKLRKSYGELSSRVFQSLEDPNEVTILFEWESPEKAQSFLQSPDLAKTMEKAGVVRKPTATFLYER